MRSSILAMVEEKGNIPPLPDILVRLESKIEDPKSNISDISILIETEPILAGRMIQLSNSVFFNRGGNKVENLSQAIIRLGLKMILDLAYTLEVPKLFMKGKGLKQNKFWEHSLAVAIMSRILSQRLEGLRIEQDMCYLSGLMHDIGIMVFNYLIPEEYAKFLKQIGGTESSLHVLEAQKFGISHPELGSVFIKKWWPVPEEVVTSVGMHYLTMSNQGKKYPILLTVIIANAIANANDMGNGISHSEEPINYSFLAQQGVSREVLDEIVEETRESLYLAKEVLYK
ncbi:MAG: HDOD domain-containing protein [Nitrospinota bacterium]|nr:HDOD domain-containing protein [Nitrospinota bacterium]MDH5789031.1 HDOD domain-containing protein [Nitrospinota bacterium]